MEQLQSAYDNQQRLISQKERTIERFKAKATKAKMAQSMVKELERMERLDPPDSDSNTINIRFPEAPRSGAVVYEANKLGHAYGKNLVFSGLDLKIERGDRIAMVGQNGQGKSTLAKIISGELSPSIGNLVEGHNVNLGYFAQNQAEKMNSNLTVQQVAEAAARPETLSKVRSILGAFLFPGEEVEKKVKVLSGGERSRLAISLLLHNNYNVLLLDEPTNHLDIYSKEVLKQALKEYDGTLLIISHDREFLKGLAQKTLSFRDGEIKLHLEDVETYLKNQSIGDMRALEMQKEQSKDGSNGTSVTSSNLSDNQKKQIERKVKEIEREIDKLTKQLQKIEVKMAAEEFYASAEAVEETKKHADLAERVAAKEAEWEEMVGRLEM
jgi:ATP-binding cassette subfamily F protein 3